MVSSAGSTYIKTSVLKDDHTFTVHVIDPKESTPEDSDNETGDDGKEGSEKAEFEKPEKDNKESKYRTFTVHVIDPRESTQEDTRGVARRAFR